MVLNCVIVLSKPFQDNHAGSGGHMLPRISRCIRDFENNIARRMEQAFLSRRCSGNQHGSDITIGIRISAIFILLARERIRERTARCFNSAKAEK